MQKAHKAIWERDYIKSILLARESFKMKKTLPPIQEDETEPMDEEESAEKNVSRNLSKAFMKLAVTENTGGEPMSVVEPPVRVTGNPLNTMPNTQCRVAMMEWPSTGCGNGNGKRFCTENGAIGGYGAHNMSWDPDNGSPTSSSDDQQWDLEHLPLRRRRHRSSNSI
ncbi:uncharacterized protein LOC6585478 [Drosophila mojavensis]|uniref:Uncharacterized protein n=1 Tax=Drosophila mojavensis TaxID=7230 RepID=B4L6F2_DROMO|nr:uncharacterized protein LOC6585478 [Drosophila mojavensis]EDW05948.2 uncharacterized protein Dmoj_GI16358 [Drosophila mojavensis]